MSTRSLYSIGAYASGEGVVSITHRGVTATSKRAVIFLHGANGSATYALSLQNWASQIDLVRKILDAGYWMFSIDAGGPLTWGNDLSITRIGEAKTWIQANFAVPSGKVHLLGVSMGATVALNYAKANPSNVASLVGAVPVIDIEYVRANNISGAASGINTAYGGTYVNATERADHNPSYYAGQGGLAGVPIQLWYATDDIFVPDSTYTDFGVASGADMRSVGALGHGDPAIAAIDENAMLAFMDGED